MSEVFRKDECSEMYTAADAKGALLKTSWNMSCKTMGHRKITARFFHFFLRLDLKALQDLYLFTPVS